jgi:hypothetical protein
MNLAAGKWAESVAEVGLTPAERELVAAWLPVLDREVPAVAKHYYDHLRNTEVERLLTPDRFDRLLEARIAHWRLLLRGDFAAVSEDYAERFGRRLFDAGFPLRIFVVAADWFTVEFTRLIDSSPDLPDAVRNDLRIALMKFAFLDLVLAHASREVTYLD